MRTVFVIPCFFLVFAGVAGQVKIPEMIQLEYNINKSDNGVNIYETRLGGRKVFTLGNFRLTATLDLHKFDLDHTYTDITERGVSFTEAYIMRAEVSVARSFAKGWSFTAFVRPEAASDFHGDWTDEGFNISYGGYLTKAWEHRKGAASTLVIGLEYSTAFGKPRLVPILNYSRKINEHWSYAAGYPYTCLTWTVNARHKIKPLIDFDAFYAGVNTLTGYFGEGEDMLYRLNYLSVNGRVDYEYYFNRGWNLVAGLGYSVYNQLSLYRGRHKEFTYDMASAPYISLGIKHNF